MAIVTSCARLARAVQTSCPLPFPASRRNRASGRGLLHCEQGNGSDRGCKLNMWLARAFGVGAGARSAPAQRVWQSGLPPACAPTRQGSALPARGRASMPEVQCSVRLVNAAQRCIPRHAGEPARSRSRPPTPPCRPLLAWPTAEPARMSSCAHTYALPLRRDFCQGRARRRGRLHSLLHKPPPLRGASCAVAQGLRLRGQYLGCSGRLLTGRQPQPWDCRKAMAVGVGGRCRVWALSPCARTACAHRRVEIYPSTLEYFHA